MNRKYSFLVGVILGNILNFVVYIISFSCIEFILFRNIKINIVVYGGFLFMLIEIFYSLNDGKMKRVFDRYRELEIDEDGR